MLKYKKKKEGKEYALRVPSKILIGFANRRISEVSRNFGSRPVFIKYFGIKDYSDRGENSLYLQLGLVSPRNPLMTVKVMEWDDEKKSIEEKEVHPLYDSIEALEEMCLDFSQ